ncbi:MAG: TetR/AcrR family transcriptional regulator [Chitinophagales bacterium]|nr:TetR/AcrR family transcriptional regulator [Chitinophagales bacterium]
MGRKALEKERSDNSDKKKEWIKKLSPIFHQNGINHYTMDHIAEIMNKSKATVYKYFNSRDEIIEMCVENNLNAIALFEDKLNDSKINYIERYKLATRIFMENISLMSTKYLEDLKKLYPDLWNKVRDFQEKSIVILSNYYKVGIENGHFNDIHPGILATSDQLFFQILIDPQFLINNQLTPLMAFEEYFKMKCYGMLPRNAK